MGRPRSGGQPGPSASRAPGGRSRSASRSTPKGSEWVNRVPSMPCSASPQGYPTGPSSSSAQPGEHSPPHGSGCSRTIPQVRTAFPRCGHRCDAAAPRRLATRPPVTTRDEAPATSARASSLPQASGDQACCRSRRSGSSPPRPVHQWTARAWVSRRPAVGRAVGASRPPVASFLLLAAQDDKRSRLLVRRAVGQGRPSRPASTASATRSPSRAAASIAVQQCSTQSPTPAASPRP